jgi:hypothetical protein
MLTRIAKLVLLFVTLILSALSPSRVYGQATVAYCIAHPFDDSKCYPPIIDPNGGLAVPALPKPPLETGTQLIVPTTEPDHTMDHLLDKPVPPFTIPKQQPPITFSTPPVATAPTQGDQSAPHPSVSTVPAQPKPAGWVAGMNQALAQQRARRQQQARRQQYAQSQPIAPQTRQEAADTLVWCHDNPTSAARMPQGILSCGNINAWVADKCTTQPELQSCQDLKVALAARRRTAQEAPSASQP